MSELEFMMKTRNSSVASNESEEFSLNTSDIDYTIYDDCKQSKLKIIFMANSDLKSIRPIKPRRDSSFT